MQNAKKKLHEILNFKIYFSTYWKNIFFQASGNAVAQVIGILGIPLLTRIYSPEDFSIQGLFVQSVMFLAGIVTLRYEYFIQLPEGESESLALQRLVFWIGLFFVFIFTPIVWSYSNEISYLLGNENISPWLAGVPITAFFVSLALAIQHKTQRQGDFKSSAASEIVGKFSYVLSGMAGYFLNFGSFGLIGATAFSALGKIALLLRKNKRNLVEIKFSNLFEQFKKYSKLSRALVFSHLLTTIASFLPIIAIGKIYGDNILGQFSLVLATIFLPSGFLGMAIGQVYYQRVAAIWAKKEKIHEVWNETSKKLVLIGLPLYIFIALASPFAYPLIFGSAWSVAGDIAAWVSIAGFFSFISSPLDRTCIIVGAWRYPMYWHAFRAITAALIVLLAFFENLSVDAFIKLLVAQMSFAYVIDFFMERHFSHKNHKSQDDKNI